MSTKYTCIIVDDEQYAIELLTERLNLLYKNIIVLRSFNAWTAALEGLREYQCDILFLDISMSGRNGMELLNFVPGIKSEVVFVTAHSEFAIDAFKLSASGYLLKPLNDIELAHTVDKAIERVEIKRLAKSATHGHLNNKIGIPQQNSIVYVDTNDIIYLEAVNTYTKVIVKTGELLCSYNIGKYKTLLPEHNFYQIHRSYIVNLNFICRYEHAGVVVMVNDKEIPVSKNIREDFLKLFGRVNSNSNNR